MTAESSKSHKKNKARFKPNMDNFRVSLSYEGLSLKSVNKGKSIAELKRKYVK